MTNRTQLARLGLFDAKVPRYTSYPTSPHFAGNVGPDRFAEWISAVPQDGNVSLYLHVPFCRRLCWFCACRTQGTATASPVEAYVDTLLAELAILKSHLPQGVKLSRLHWGGGTPTLLSPDMMTRLTDAIHDVAGFADGAEFSVEIDPNEIDEARLDALAAGGMNRASIGVQDFDEQIQETIGRQQGFEVTRRAVDMIRERGVASLNADILYGLPHQTNARITETVQKLLSFGPDRVALYGYAHVPWMAKRQQMIPSDALPTPEERLDLFETARKLFLWDNYDEIGIDHFATKSDGLAVAARAGRLRRNFQGYTDDTSEVLIGVGASSISKFPQGYAQNAPGTSAHTQAIREGRFSTARGHMFQGEDVLRGRLIEAVMCDFRVSAAEITRDHDITRDGLFTMFRQVNDQFEGLLQITDDGLYIPEAVRPLTRLIARSFDGYELSKAGHSSAI
ncbi:oxygen-independent coproporphyrinogen III oxidase [Tropicibacter naphthalenivorans]|uniref:Coproporphyrinogen-III oxidase n=1 Tax=Tropicibacter naphthalenivorans TaxID=441103 RepID=A0A0P1GUX8_9RHOB|nr:oxygen-independent coproporphyrinogen III oxidase [Tropicibacter naphthalenivorans]CUH77893.1 Oxygen-independent coproporphyrinogen-III oxidase [Tropicibacter naphthalenivorans]SMC95269.1 oxygen-independent coproporphyrinogen-3 oxidase [Tropicibacter naphthalenivorans]